MAGAFNRIRVSSFQITAKKGKLWLLNLNNLAKEFAKIPKTITIIFFDACRDNLEEPAYKRVLDNAIQNDPMFKY